MERTVDGTIQRDKIRFASDKVSLRPKKKEKLNIKAEIVKYILLFCFSLVLWQAETSKISPFSSGYILGLFMLGQNYIILLPMYTISALLGTMNFQKTISALCLASVLSSASFVEKRMKRLLPRYVYVLAGIVGQSASLYFALSKNEGIVFYVIELFVSLVFSYAVVGAIKPYINKGIALRPVTTEMALGGIFVAVLSLGLACVDGIKVNLLYLIGYFVVLLATASGGKGAGIITAVCVGVGGAMKDYTTLTLAFMPFISLVAVALSDAPRPLFALSGIVGAIAFMLYLNVPLDNLSFDLLSVTIGGLCFCVLPKSIVNKLSTTFAKSDKLAVRALINGGRATASQQIKKAETVFGEMSRALRRSTLENTYSLEEITLTVSSICGECEACDKSALKGLVQTTIQKGRASVNDCTELIRFNCPRLAQLISVTADEVERVRRTTRAQTTRDMLREELAQQLDCVCAVLNRRATLTGAPIECDKQKEDALLDELAYCGEPALDVMVTKAETESIIVVCATKPLDEGEKIAKTAERVLKNSYAVESITSASIGKISLVTLREKTPYDALFATSAVSKNSNATGDTHSFLRISDTKFMMALCDGMGSGANASRISETAIDLVESFFKAGFDGEFVLKSVNKFLSGIEDESFSAFDVLVCDLSTLERTIIKLGSPQSYICQQAGVLPISGNALPLGALGDLVPFVHNGTAEDGETIIFLSDGVTDSVSEQELVEIIAQFSTSSVRSLCDAIIELARSKNIEVKDDMTAIAVRIMHRI